jgi:hypothetical protein
LLDHQHARWPARQIAGLKEVPDDLRRLTRISRRGGAFGRMIGRS